MDREMTCPVCKGPVDRWGICKLRCYERIKSKFPNASASFAQLNPHLVGDAPGPKHQPNPGHEPVAALPRTVADPVRRVVRITALRCQLLDGENVWTKYFTDALRYAGILFDDSPSWCEVQVQQKIVHRFEDEATLIEIV